MKNFEQIRKDYGVLHTKDSKEMLFRAVSCFAAEAWMKGDEEFSQVLGTTFNAVTGDDCKEWNIGKSNIRRLANEKEFQDLLSKSCFLFKEFVKSDLNEEHPTVDSLYWSCYKENPLFSTTSCVLKQYDQEWSYSVRTWYMKKTATKQEQLKETVWVTSSSLDEVLDKLKEILVANHSYEPEEQVATCKEIIVKEPFAIFFL